MGDGRRSWSSSGKKRRRPRSAELGGAARNGGGWSRGRPWLDLQRHGEAGGEVNPREIGKRKEKGEVGRRGAGLSADGSGDGRRWWLARHIEAAEPWRPGLLDAPVMAGKERGKRERDGEGDRGEKGKEREQGRARGEVPVVGARGQGLLRHGRLHGRGRLAPVMVSFGGWMD